MRKNEASVNAFRSMFNTLQFAERYLKSDTMLYMICGMVYGNPKEGLLLFYALLKDGKVGMENW